MKEEIEKEVEDKLAINKQELINRTENLVAKEGFRYLEALIHICKELELDPEDIAKLVTGPLKEKLKCEAQNNHVLPKSNTATFE